MIKIETHPNFSKWQTIFAFGKIVKQVQGRAKALRIAKEIAKENRKSVLSQDGEIVEV